MRIAALPPGGKHSRGQNRATPGAGAESVAAGWPHRYFPRAGPATRPRMGRSQVVRQRILIPPFPGSNPGAPASKSGVRPGHMGERSSRKHERQPRAERVVDGSQGSQLCVDRAEIGVKPTSEAPSSTCLIPSVRAASTVARLIHFLCMQMRPQAATGLSRLQTVAATTTRDQDVLNLAGEMACAPCAHRVLNAQRKASNLSCCRM